MSQPNPSYMSCGNFPPQLSARCLFCVPKTARQLSFFNSRSSSPSSSPAEAASLSLSLLPLRILLLPLKCRSLPIRLKLAFYQLPTSRLKMPFEKDSTDLFFWVNPGELDISKTRASKKKNGGAFEFRRKRKESHIHARARHMTTSTSNTKSRAYSTKFEVPPTSVNESKMPCVETQELVMAVYFISRSFTTDVVQEVLRGRFDEKHDPKTVGKAESLLKTGEFHHGKDGYELDLVDLWLNKQTSYEYGNLLFLIEIDDRVSHIAQAAVGAPVLYTQSLDLPNIRDKTLVKCHIWR